MSSGMIGSIEVDCLGGEGGLVGVGSAGKGITNYGELVLSQGRASELLA
ncbi:hypothetical protein SAMN02745225_00514 [Ferrithrix thermotolerans DSM 19514]|uniref:Uncharacterized protein n=1 Tax=Ferrithrix thermotolerans DSM 19514 TaxID=1121881 RepID=A0A1M4T6D6_9ACTN|nr:hypothetical protein [Ferrithrix thermotolerans]SHE39878.1 hypothetical protein SAMN02745225_00514 [Ferrithrix thermotolerans DSM 19514]